MANCVVHSFLKCPGTLICDICGYYDPGLEEFKDKLKAAIGPIDFRKREAIETYIREFKPKRKKNGKL